MAKLLPIGVLSRETGVKVSTIRFYEEIGLLPAAPRTPSNRRNYDADDVRRLRFIRHARDLGFHTEVIRQLLALAAHPDQPCSDADELARTHLDEIDAKIARLVALRSEIRAMVERCDSGAVRDCRVMEVLRDDTKCDHEPRMVLRRAAARSNTA